MATLPYPCPKECSGYLEVFVSVSTDHTYSMVGDNECIISVTITCQIVAECDTCTYFNVVSEEKKEWLFDQAYELDTIFKESNLDLFAENEKSLVEGGQYHEY